MTTKENSLSSVKGNSLGASGFTIAITGFVLSGVFGIILSITSFIFCYVQQKKKPTKLGKAGLILSVLAFIFSIVWIAYLGPMYMKWLQSVASSLPTA